MTSWCLVGLAAALSLYTHFARWAVNAESFGRQDPGWALFFSFSGAWTLVACFWPALAALGAAPGALPFLVMR